MLNLVMLLLFSSGAYHQITFDTRVDADSYKVYISRSPQFGRFQTRTCTGSPCTIWIRRPWSGRVLYVSVVGVNAAGEGPK